MGGTRGRGCSQTQWEKSGKEKDNDVRSLFKSCPREFLASQHGVFVPRDSPAAKGLSLLLVTIFKYENKDQEAEREETSL